MRRSCGVDRYPAVVAGKHRDGTLLPGMVISVEGCVGAVGGSAGAKYEDQIIVTDGSPEVISFAPAEHRFLS